MSQTFLPPLSLSLSPPHPLSLFLPSFLCAVRKILCSYNTKLNRLKKSEGKGGNDGRRGAKMNFPHITDFSNSFPTRFCANEIEYQVLPCIASNQMFTKFPNLIFSCFFLHGIPYIVKYK